MAINRILYEEYEIPCEISNEIWNICIKEKISRAVHYKQDINKELLETTKGIYYGIELNYDAIESCYKYSCGCIHWNMKNNSLANLDANVAVSDAAQGLSYAGLLLEIRRKANHIKRCALSIAHMENLTHHISSIYCMANQFVVADVKDILDSVPIVIQEHIEMTAA